MIRHRLEFPWADVAPFLQARAGWRATGSGFSTFSYQRCYQNRSQCSTWLFAKQKREMSLFLLQTFELSDEVCIPWISRVTSSDADVFVMLVPSRRSLVAQPCPSRQWHRWDLPRLASVNAYLLAVYTALSRNPRLTNRLALDRGREFVGVLHKGLSLVRLPSERL